MAKVKFSLVAAPTFKAAVGIPVAGSVPVKVEFTFRHRTKDAFTEFMKANSSTDDLDVICGRSNPVNGDELADTALGICTNWELEEPFNRDNVEVLLQNYPGAARAIVDKYVAEAGQVRLGN